MSAVLRLQVSTTQDLADAVEELLTSDPAVSAVARLRGASVVPRGDVLTAELAREGANAIVDRLRALGVQREGSISVEPVQAWLSRPGLDAERRTPGSAADSVVWLDVAQRAYDDSELNWTYVSFMCLATLIASIAIVLDSQVLVIGAMVLGPEFVPIAALGLALVRRRPALLRRAATTTVVGFAASILVATLLAFLARALGWITRANVVGPRPQTDFIYSPDKWSFLLAMTAAAAGVLSLTSAKVGGLSGVFISVTTVPASGNVALGLAFGAWSEVTGSAMQLAINISGMALAGWITLAVQQAVGGRMSRRQGPSAVLPGGRAGTSKRSPG
jgi:uncharacterized hydrophobic protein (TIGR00271 family)